MLQQQTDDVRIRSVVPYGKHQGAVRAKILPAPPIDGQAHG